MFKEFSIAILLVLVGFLCSLLGYSLAVYEENVAQRLLDKYEDEIQFVLDSPSISTFSEHFTFLQLMEASEVDDAAEPLEIVRLLIWLKLVDELPKIEKLCENRDSETMQELCDKQLSRTRYYIEKYAHLQD